VIVQVILSEIAKLADNLSVARMVAERRSSSKAVAVRYTSISMVAPSCSLTVMALHSRMPIGQPAHTNELIDDLVQIDWPGNASAQKRAATEWSRSKRNGYLA